MRPNARIALLTATTVLAVAGLVLILSGVTGREGTSVSSNASVDASAAGSVGAGTSTTGAGSASGFDGAALPSGVRAYPFTLTAVSAPAGRPVGMPVSLSAYRGQVVVLAFMYPACGATCILIAQQIRGALNELSRPATVIIVNADPASADPASSADRASANAPANPSPASTDPTPAPAHSTPAPANPSPANHAPANPTPANRATTNPAPASAALITRARTRARVESMLAQVSLAGRVYYLNGSPAQLRAVWHAYGVTPASAGRGAFDAAATVYLIDKAGFERVEFGVEQLTPEGLAHDIARLQAG